MSLYNYIRQCLQTEMRLVKAASGEGLGGMPHMVLSTMGTEIIQQIEMLRIRTTVGCFFLMFLIFTNVSE